ncbi:hypothetical protein Tcan_04717 [Toxocara canis]|uniref:Uncharacterized protein n=1 Tax=Toxocara canis TaxID=6265 RepID=A0A0B2VDC4_TOXCA|nr:hypothetical protein Tcan_04717 [Toxocara canis]
MATMHSVAHDALSETRSWILAKYTKLCGMRYEVSGTSGDLRVTVNGHLLIVSIGTSSLEEFSLSITPSPTIKSKENDVFFQVVSQHSSYVLARFRIKFMSENDLRAFSQLVSRFINIETTTIRPQCFARDQSVDRVEVDPFQTVPSLGVENDRKRANSEQRPCNQPSKVFCEVRLFL